MMFRYLIVLVTGVWLVTGGCASQGGVGASDPAWAEAREKGLVPIKRVPPEYPRKAALAGVQGCVTITFDVRPDGLTDNYEILDSRPQGVFVREALLALKDWRFPERDVTIRTQQLIEFKLDRASEDEVPQCSINPDLPPEVFRIGDGG